MLCDRPTTMPAISDAEVLAAYRAEVRSVPPVPAGWMPPAATEVWSAGVADWVQPKPFKAGFKTGRYDPSGLQPAIKVACPSPLAQGV
jgi:hypothetical protein